MSNREAKFQDLLRLKDEKINALQKEIDRNDKFIFVQKPTEQEEYLYREKISELCSNEFFKYYISILQHEVMDSFTCDGEHSEFYRGQMALISTIMTDSKKALDTL